MKGLPNLDIPYTSFMDKSGAVVDDLPAWADAETLARLYRAMSLTRLYDTRAIALQRTGQLGTFGACTGQEAIGAGIGFAMQADDVLLPTYREAGAQIIRGVGIADLLRYWGGDERGMAFDGPVEDFPVCVPIATQTTQAAGVAYAFKVRKQARSALCVIGDGGSSKGDFYEALNLAGAWQLPLVFLVVNNGWAISVRREQQSATPTLAQKAIAGGVPCEQVDGNDVVAVAERLMQALKDARSGKGARVIEAITWRLCDHTTSDDATRYRQSEEVQEHWQADPLRRLRRYLASTSDWSDADEKAQHAELKMEVEAAVTDYLNTPAAPATAMFDHLHAELPAAYLEQRAELTQASEEGGND